MEINRITMQEIRQVEDILPGGSIEYNDLTSIKVTGSIPYIDGLDIGNNYLRIWLDTTDINNVTESLALGTFLISTPTATVTPAKVSGDADLYSVLQILNDSALREPLTIPIGTIAVTYATNLVLNAGLSVMAQDSAAMLSTNKVFDAGISKLDIINELLQVAGFDSAEVDGFGNVLLRSYLDPTGTSPSLTLDTGSRTILLPELSHELDIFSVPNVYVAVMSNDNNTMVAIAINADPANRYSTVSRGREIVEVESVSDIASQTLLQEYAENTLRLKTTAVESITIKHLFIPYNAGDTVRVIAGGLDFVGSVANRKVTLDKTMLVESRIRKFVRF